MQAQSVCLITPPSTFLLDQRTFPFLGPLKVAAVLRQAGFEVESLDLTGYENYLDVVELHTRNSTSTIFGVTATTPHFPAAVKIAEAIHRVRPDARIILGGSHATLTVAGMRSEKRRGVVSRAHKAYAQLEEFFDVIVAGDGEEAIFEACKSDAPKLIDADGRKSPFGKFFLDDARLNASPFPARDLIDLPSYHYKVDGFEATTLIAQLGCPMPCGFCGGRFSPTLRHIRTRTTENIVEEMTELYQQYGYRGFMMYDDELNVSKTMIELMQAIGERQRKLGTTWHLRGFIKSELFTDEQAKAMHFAGFRQILVGFESGSPRILKNIRKQATREDNTECVRISHANNLKVKALMSIGHPGESVETIKESVNWLLEVKPFDFDCTTITPYPGSPYYDLASEVGDGLYVYEIDGDKLYQVEIDYARDVDNYKGIPGQYVSHVHTDYLSAKELVRWREAFERFVRRKLGIPYNPSAAAINFEHSMGQTALPTSILRTSSGTQSLSA